MIVYASFLNCGPFMSLSMPIASGVLPLEEPRLLNIPLDLSHDSPCGDSLSVTAHES